MSTNSDLLAFSASLMYVSIVSYKKSEKVFIDARKFLFHPSSELVGPWRTKNISPLYNEAGVRKFAFLYPTGSPIPQTNGQNMRDEKFPTAFFTSESELRKWLSD
jgi:hypothetical protein